MGWCFKAVVGVVLAIVALELIEVDDFVSARALRLGWNVWLIGLVRNSNDARVQCRTLSDFIFSAPESERGYWQHWASYFGGFSIGQKAMRDFMHDPEMLHACAQFFCAMANFNRETSLRATESGAIETLLAAMDRFPNHAGLQAQASASMGCWCDWTPENERKVARLGGPRAILRAISTFPADTNVQFLGWAGLSSVSNEIPSKRLIIEAGAITTGMATMRDPELRKGFRVRQEIIMTFCNLAANCNECVNDIVATGDIIEQVKQAMDEEVPDAQRGTKTDGIQLMMELAANNRTTRRAILDAGFLSYTLQGMKQFPMKHPQNAWPLCEFGLRLLTSLVDEDGALAEIKALGGTEILETVLRTVPERMPMGQQLLSRVRGA